MKLEIFVVTTKLKEIGKAELEMWRTDLTKLFNGITIIPNCSGLWLNDNKQIEKDNLEIWLIYTTKEQYFINETVFLLTLRAIKSLTQQKTQAYAIDNTIKFF